MDRLFSDVFGEAYGGGDEGRSPMFHLPVDIKETEDGYVIKAPVPGFKPEDVEITFSDGVLTISANQREEKEEKEGQYLRREIAFGNYQRRIALPGDIRADGIKARFEDGVLSIQVPRAPKPEPVRIQVQPGDKSREAQAGGGAQTVQEGPSSDQPSSSGEAEPVGSQAAQTEASSRS
jgi:HSP20 family protein